MFQLFGIFPVLEYLRLKNESRHPHLEKDSARMQRILSMFFENYEKTLPKDAEPKERKLRVKKQQHILLLYSVNVTD